MNTKRFKQVEHLFKQARGLDANQRAALLDDACADDPKLRAEIESLLREHDRPTDQFLQEPALGSGFEVKEPKTEPDIGQAPSPERIGPYRVLRLLGEGGMGVVYLAEQEKPRRTIALKLIKTGFVTRAVLRRFEHEAEALGRLHHPGIAQVYEAGVHHDGSGSAGAAAPFIAMEFIEGPPVIEYVRRERLSLRRRLDLFMHICDAVEHAHRRGVIHRDLKPGNILIDLTSGSPQPKILDFGVARITDSDIQATTVQTDVGQLLGTIQYMSPEQAAGDPLELDLRSDVYALGVILYELLAGRLPYELDRKMLHEAVRVIREQEPTPLSSVSRIFRGDLNTILAKALEKDKDRRYQSAADLAADIRRYLADEPITAHPPSAMYQLSKFARRNRALVIGAAVVVVVLVAGMITASIGWAATSRARQADAAQRQRAEQRFEEVRKLANVFLFEFDDRIRHLTGALPARELIVQTGLEYLDRLAKEAGDDPELLQELAAAYMKLGDVQFDPNVANIGDTAGALESQRKAIAILEPIATSDPGSAARTLALAHTKYADISRAMNRTEESMSHYRRAEQLVIARVEADPGDAAALGTLADVLERISGALREQGHLEESRAAIKRSQEVAKRVNAANPDDPKAKRGLAVSHFSLGMAALAAEDFAEAEQSFGDFVPIIESLALDYPENAVYQRDLWVGLDRLGQSLAAQDRTDEALPIYERALAVSKQLVSAAPDDFLALGGVSTLAIRLGEIRLAQGEHDAAVAHFQESLEAAAARAALDPENAGAQREHGVTFYKMGEIHAAFASDDERSTAERIQQWREARSWFQRCYETFVDMRERGLLWESDAGVPDEISGEIINCDTAIAELEGNTEAADLGLESAADR